jgi:O-antigen/teichoic acid export membrane protein
MSADKALTEDKRSHWPISILMSVAALINMLLPLFLVRVLTPEEVGTYKVFFLYTMVLPPFTFALGIINGLSFWAGREKERDEAIGISGTLVLISAVVFNLVVAALSVPIAHLIGWSVSSTLLLAVSVTAVYTSMFYQEVEIALGRTWRGAIFNGAFEVIRTGSLLAFAVSTHSLTAILVVHATTMWLKLVVGYALAYRRGWVHIQWASFRGETFKAVLSYANPVSLATIFGVFVNYADQVILSTYISKAAFALYAVGCLSVPPLSILEMSVTRVLIPQLSAAFAESRLARAASLYRKAVDDLGYILIPAVAGMMIFANPIIHLLFTWQYESATGYLRLYALSYLTLMIPYDSVPRSRGESRWILLNFGAFSIPTLIVCWLATWFYGPYGAMIAMLVSKFGMRFYGAWYVAKSTGWKLVDFLPLGPSLVYAVVSAVLGMICVALRPTFGRDIFWFLWCGSGFTVAYFGSTYFWRKKFEGRLIAARQIS